MSRGILFFLKAAAEAAGMSEYCRDSDFLPAADGILHQAGGCRPASQTRFPGKIMGNQQQLF